MYARVELIGRLAADPEMRYTPNGAAVTELRLPVSRKYKSADGTLVEETTWFRVTVWGKQAETANQYLSKGKMIFVEGVLVPDPKTGGPRVFQRKDGTYGASFEVKAENFRFLSPKGDNESAAEPAAEPF